MREELSGHGENPKIDTRACQKQPRWKAALQREWGQAANTIPTHHHRQLEVPAFWHVFWKAWVRSKRLGARWGPLPQPKVATDVDIPEQIRGRGAGGKENESEVGMKRREGGVIVSSRLGAAGRVFARVCVCWLLCVRFCTSSAAAPCQYAGRAHENPAQQRFEYTTFQKLPLTKSDPAWHSLCCNRFAFNLF